MRQVTRLAIGGRTWIQFDNRRKRSEAVGHRDAPGRVGSNTLVPSHRQDVGRRIGQKRPQVPGRFEAQRGVDGGTQTFDGGRVGIEAEPCAPQVHHRLAEICTRHDERMAERRAARSVPSDSVSSARGSMKVSRRSQHVIGRTRRLEPGFGEKVAAVE